MAKYDEIRFYTFKTLLADTIRQQVEDNLDIVIEALRDYRSIIDALVDEAKESKRRAEEMMRAEEPEIREMGRRFYQHYDNVLSSYNPLPKLQEIIEFIETTRDKLWKLAKEIEDAETREKVKTLWEEVKKTIYEYVTKDINMPGIKLSQELIKVILWLDEDVKSL